MSDDLLLSLPVNDKPIACKNCGKEDWGRARTKDGYVIMCNKCPGVPDDWSPIIELN